jgi:RNA-directed DNA polymerase
VGSFDHISHQWMLNHVFTDKVVLQKWLKAGYIETRRGQGDVQPGGS